MNRPNVLRTIDGATLMSQPLRPQSFVVDTLLSQGLHILAGSPKVGKSWLALWLAVTIAKGETIWGMGSKRGTTLYLCLEDSLLRIQNRLLEVTEDAPGNVHFCTESALISRGLEQQLEAFLAEHPDTVLVIIDTLQMVRGAYDQTYANDYRDLSALKKLADAHGIAILLIHHLRKETAEDKFSRISGTTAISGAVDSSLLLVEDERGSGNATLYCIGRDIEYGELELARDENNVWQLKRDHRTLPKGGVLPFLLSELMSTRTEFTGTPTELVQRIDPDGREHISPRKISGQVAQSVAALRKEGIEAAIRRSNGKRLIELHRADSDVDPGAGNNVPIDPDTLQDAAGGDVRGNALVARLSPDEAQRSGFGGKRRSSGAQERLRPRRKCVSRSSRRRGWASRAPVCLCRSLFGRIFRAEARTHFGKRRTAIMNKQKKEIRLTLGKLLSAFSLMAP